MEKREQKIYCNRCGKQMHTELTARKDDYLDVQKEWGYFSGKDGEIHHFVLCESCYDELIKQFRIPVDVKIQTELL